MLLVPEGEFIFDEDKYMQRLWLPDFYIDKGTVTISRYAAFLKATGHQEPFRWSEQGAGAGSENRPVGEVTWDDAYAYCSYYGKRLPREQEWEKAATGTKGLLASSTDGFIFTGGIREWTGSHNGTSDRVVRRGVLLNGTFTTALTRFIRPGKDIIADVGFRCVSMSPAEQELARLDGQDLQTEGKTPAGTESEQMVHGATISGSATSNAAKPEVIGKDNAPMLLVPGGRFLYGDNNQPLTLPDFYMDKYEVTMKHYAAFLKAIRRQLPPSREGRVELVANGELPVWRVTGEDAILYCSYYGKRLPSEQEWEKAARSTDGRKYPWGNEEPASRHISVMGYRESPNVASVGSHPAGASPYGIQDLAGSVREWTGTHRNGKYEMGIRGGSYLSRRTPTSTWKTPGLITSLEYDLGFRCAQDVEN